MDDKMKVLVERLINAATMHRKHPCEVYDMVALANEAAATICAQAEQLAAAEAKLAALQSAEGCDIEGAKHAYALELGKGFSTHDIALSAALAVGCAPLRMKMEADRQHWGKLVEDAVALNAASEAVIERLRKREDEAFTERNCVVGALSKLFPAGTKDTNIPGWDPHWHHTVYIDLPTGQVSWHCHDRDRGMWAHLKPYQGEWDGHDTPTKYARLSALKEPANG